MPSDLILVRMSGLRGVTAAEVLAAIPPDRRELPRHDFEVDLRPFAGAIEGGDWEGVRAALHGAATRIRDLANDCADPEIHFFGLAEVPAVICFAADLGAERKVVAHEYDRDEGRWAWPENEGRALDVCASHVPVERLEASGRATIRVEISSEVLDQDVERVVSTPPLVDARLRIPGMAPTVATIRSEWQVRAVRHAFRAALGKIRSHCPRLTGIDLFVAAPVSIAFVVGQELVPRNSVPIRTYRYRPGAVGGPMHPAIELSGGESAGVEPALSRGPRAWTDVLEAMATSKPDTRGWKDYSLLRSPDRTLFELFFGLRLSAASSERGRASWGDPTAWAILESAVPFVLMMWAISCIGAIGVGWIFIAEDVRLLLRHAALCTLLASISCAGLAISVGVAAALTSLFWSSVAVFPALLIWMLSGVDSGWLPGAIVAGAGLGSAMAAEMTNPDRPQFLPPLAWLLPVVAVMIPIAVALILATSDVDWSANLQTMGSTIAVLTSIPLVATGVGRARLRSPLEDRKSALVFHAALVILLPGVGSFAAWLSGPDPVAHTALGGAIIGTMAGAIASSVYGALSLAVVAFAGRTVVLAPVVGVGVVAALIVALGIAPPHPDQVVALVAGVCAAAVSLAAVCLAAKLLARRESENHH